MDIKGIIFDLDGVIVSTDHLHYLAWKQLAERESIDFDQQTNNRLRGVSRMESLEILLEKSKRTYTFLQKQDMADYKNRIYRRSLNNLSERDLLPGVEDVLVTLRQKGILLAIGSSSKNAPAILEQIGLGSFFDAAADGNDISKSKPDPEVFLLAAERLGLPPPNCVVVEDARAGIDAANAGGFFSVALGDAYGYDKSAASIRSIDELLKLLYVYR